MNLQYRSGNEANVTVVYEGAIARLEDSNRLSVYDSNLQLLNQLEFSNMPKNPLDYRNKV